MKETRPEKLERISQLAEKGKRDGDEMAEYSIKFYYTNQVTEGMRENQVNKKSKIFLSCSFSLWRALTTFLYLLTPSSST